MAHGQYPRSTWSRIVLEARYGRVSTLNRGLPAASSGPCPRTPGPDGQVATPALRTSEDRKTPGGGTRSWGTPPRPATRLAIQSIGDSTWLCIRAAEKPHSGRLVPIEMWIRRRERYHAGSDSQRRSNTISGGPSSAEVLRSDFCKEYCFDLSAIVDKFDGDTHTDENVGTHHRPRMFISDVHTTDQGNEAIAREVARLIAVNRSDDALPSACEPLSSSARAERAAVDCRSARAVRCVRICRGVRLRCLRQERLEADGRRQLRARTLRLQGRNPERPSLRRWARLGRVDASRHSELSLSGLSSRRWNAVAVAIFLVALTITFGDVWRAGPRTFVPSMQIADQALATMVRSDIEFETWLVARHAYTIIRQPSRLFDTEHCAPGEKTLIARPAHPSPLGCWRCRRVYWETRSSRTTCPSRRSSSRQRSRCTC